MANHSSIATLIELATKESDAAAKRLGVALRAGEETEQKRALLLQYRDDYAARCQTGLSTGLTAMGYQNFRVFLEKLETAIVGQRDIVSEAHRRISEARTAWQASERKRMSYGTLASRAFQEARRQEMRRDQKLTDEHAARQFLYKR